jgi:hypothetical protein
MEDEACIGEGEEFHILGADGQNARAGDCVDSRLMKQMLVGGAL